VPQLSPGGRAQPPTSGGVRGPFVTWQVFRGPASATFEARNIPVKDGKAPSSVTFTVPGEYVLLGRASDRILFTDRLIKITVTGTARQ